MLYSWTCSMQFLKDLLYFTTRVLDTSDTSATRAIGVRHEWDKSDTSATRVRHMRHDCYTNDTSVTQVKNFDSDNDTSENIFSHPYISYIANGKWKEQFDYKNYFLEMPRFHAKMRLKSAPQKLNLVMAKDIKKLYTRL